MLAEIGDLQNVDQFIKLPNNLPTVASSPRVTPSCGIFQIMRWSHIQRIDAVAAATEHPRNCVSTPKVFSTKTEIVCRMIPDGPRN